jgi:hypothetical protein
LSPTPTSGADSWVSSGYFHYGQHITTNLVKEVSTCSKFKEHINSRNVMLLVLGFHNCCIHKFEDMDMLQGQMHAHLLFVGFTVLFGGFTCEGDKFTCGDTMVRDVYSTENTVMIRNQ